MSDVAPPQVSSGTGFTQLRGPGWPVFEMLLLSTLVYLIPVHFASLNCPSEATIDFKVSVGSLVLFFHNALFLYLQPGECNSSLTSYMYQESRYCIGCVLHETLPGP